MEKVVLVTGGSSGIGKAICTVLAAKGYKVYGTSRYPNKINEKLPFSLVEMDVQDEVSVEKCIASLVKNEGRIDVVINNAGVGMMGAIEDSAHHELLELFDINVFGPSRVVRAVLPYMRSAKSGLIINIASIAGYMGLPYRGIYSATKSALHRITEALRHELRPFGIQACIVDPGDFATSISENRRFASKTTANSVYTSETKRIEKQINEEVSHSSDPNLVGSLIHKIIQSKEVKLAYLIGKPMQKLAVLVKKLSPFYIFEAIIRKTYGIK